MYISHSRGNFKMTHNYCGARYEMYCARGDIFRKTVVSKEKKQNEKGKIIPLLLSHSYIRRGSRASGTRRSRLSLDSFRYSVVQFVSGSHLSTIALKSSLSNTYVRLIT